MRILDITNDYIKYVCKNNDFKKYEEKYPQLFEHYYQFWSQKQDDSIFKKDDVQYSRDLILSILPSIEKKYLSNDIDISNMTIILFVGMGNTNGHAFKLQNKFVVWIPVETYLNKMDTEVFITHEIAHALHYEYSPDFYFNNKSTQKHIGRQLITEGLATYFSKLILEISDEKALWGKYLEGDSLTKWMNDCEEQFDDIKAFLKNNFDSTDDRLGIFYANDTNDIMNFRAGYFAGLKLVEKFKNISLLELSKIPREKFEHDILLLL